LRPGTGRGIWILTVECFGDLQSRTAGLTFPATSTHGCPAPAPVAVALGWSRGMAHPLVERDRFPAWPASWYLFCQARDLRRGPFSQEMLGRKLVAFRTASGRLAVLEASCSHLGADLGRGRVVGEAIQCPFHGWEYGIDGRCMRVPVQDSIPTFACQAAYPTVERHGCVFIFNGRQALFPLPFLAHEQPEGFVAARPFRFVGRSAWHMIGGNAFDCQHLSPVHGRELVGPPEIDAPHPFARRIRYCTRVTGTTACDRIVRGLVGGIVDVSITVWGGNFVLVRARFPRAESFILFSIRPVGPRETLLDGTVLVRRGQGRARAVLAPMELWVRRSLTIGFVRGDFDRLAGIDYNPHSLIESDRALAGYFEWAASLPQRPERASGSEPDSGTPPGSANGRARPSAFKGDGTLAGELT
jgi:nitrite reductase/ring-hydroxylating ferredoxin subunit